MPEIVVRAWKPGDVAQALRPAWGTRLPGPPTADDGALLVAEHEGSVVGLFTGRRTRAGITIDGLHRADAPVIELMHAVLAAHPTDRIELHVRDGTPSVHRAAVDAGFTELRRNVHVVASPIPATGPAVGTLTLRRYGELGRAGLLAVLERMWPGGVGPNLLPPECELDVFLEHASIRDGQPDTSLWRVAYDHGELAGIVLALRVGDEEQTGIIQYIGLLPARRRARLGRSLHRFALELLRRNGCRVYRDTTQTDNRAMRRLFDEAGCRTEVTSVDFLRPAAEGVEAARPGALPPMPLGAHVSLLEKASIERPAGVTATPPMGADRT